MLINAKIFRLSQMVNNMEVHHSLIQTPVPEAWMDKVPCFSTT